MAMGVERAIMLFKSCVTNNLAASLPASLIEIVSGYCKVDFYIENVWSNKLVYASSGQCVVQGTLRAFALRLSDGSVATWGRPQPGHAASVQARLKDVTVICHARNLAFAALAGDTVVCWEVEGFRGDCPPMASDLERVEGLCASDGAFAALKRDGTVTTWGCKAFGGDCSSVRSRLKGVKEIYSGGHAFAALLADGTVETWGDPDKGGLIPPSVKERLKQVQCITGASAGAFAALLSDGTVETWGNPGFGGDSSKVASQLTEVQGVCASMTSFAALKRDGTVVTWGYGDGGNSPVARKLTQVVGLSSAGRAFVALKRDGKVATWGEESGDIIKAMHALSSYEVIAVRGAHESFAALRKDGRVVVWGEKGWSPSLAVQNELHDIVSIDSSLEAFAATRNDGAVIIWGYGDVAEEVELARAAQKSKNKPSNCAVS